MHYIDLRYLHVQRTWGVELIRAGNIFKFIQVRLGFFYYPTLVQTLFFLFSISLIFTTSFLCVSFSKLQLLSVFLFPTATFFCFLFPTATFLGYPFPTLLSSVSVFQLLLFPAVSLYRLLLFSIFSNNYFFPFQFFKCFFFPNPPLSTNFFLQGVPINLGIQ